MVRIPHSLDSRLTDVGDISLTHLSALVSRNINILIYVRGWIYPRAIVRLELLGELETFNDAIGTRTRDLPFCSVEPQQVRSRVASTSVHILSAYRVAAVWGTHISQGGNNGGRCLRRSTPDIVRTLLHSKCWSGNCVIMDVANYWDTAPCSQNANRRFRDTYNIHLQGRKSVKQETRV